MGGGWGGRAKVCLDRCRNIHDPAPPPRAVKGESGSRRNFRSAQFANFTQPRGETCRIEKNLSLKRTLANLHSNRRRALRRATGRCPVGRPRPQDGGAEAVPLAVSQAPDGRHHLPPDRTYRTKRRETEEPAAPPHPDGHGADNQTVVAQKPQPTSLLPPPLVHATGVTKMVIAPHVNVRGVVPRRQSSYTLTRDAGLAYYDMCHTYATTTRLY